MQSDFYSYMGRYQLGSPLPLSLECTDATNSPIAPDAAPTCNIFDSSGTRVLTGLKLPTSDVAGTTGRFGMRILLNSDFSAGDYYIWYIWSKASFNGRRIAKIEVLAGGDADGAYDSMHYFRAPQDNFFVPVTDQGKIEKARNPSL